MVTEFFLITADTRHERAVYDALVDLPQILELHALYGDFDLLATVEMSDFDELGAFIVNEIRSVQGIRDTETLTQTRFASTDGLSPPGSRREPLADPVVGPPGKGNS